MCDTFVILPSAATESVIFGKNSDREPNEAQSLEYHPSQCFKGNKWIEKLGCPDTFIYMSSSSSLKT